MALDPGCAALAACAEVAQAVLAIDHDGRIRLANPAAGRLMGLPLDGLLGRDYRELSAGVGRLWWPAVARVLITGVGESVGSPPAGAGAPGADPQAAVAATVMPCDGGVTVVVRPGPQAAVSPSLPTGLLQQVMDQAPVGVVVLDPQGHYRLVNTFAAERAGLPAGQILGRRASEFVPAAVAQMWADRERSVLATGAAVVAEDEIPGPDGQPAVYQTVVFPVYDDAGEVNGTGAVFSDLSGRRRAEAQLVDVEVRYRELFDRASLGHLVVRPDGQVVEANRALCALLGYDRTALLALRAPDLVLGAVDPAERAARLREHGRAGYEYEDVFRHADGHAIPVLVAVDVVTDAAGTGELVTSIIRDQSKMHEITAERERALAQVRSALESRLRFEALVEASGDFIAMTDLDGGLLYLNPSGRDLIGLADGSPVAGLPLAQLVAPDPATAVQERAQLSAVRRDGRWTGESVLRGRRDGGPVPVTVSSFLVRHPMTGEAMVLATVRRDITARLAAEEELRGLAAHRSALLDRLVSAQEQERARIAADVHDDSVQALAAVDLRLGVLHRRLQAEAPGYSPDVERLQEVVGAATQRLRHLLFDLEPPPVDGSLTDSLRDVAVHLFEDSPVTWQVRGEAELSYPSRVKAVRIVKEALGNVREHAGATRVDIDVLAGPDGVEVAIVDDGCGLDPDRVSSAPGHRGLATMRDRATIAGGWWRLERSACGGTTVRFWLPRT